ncbi:hypothetical protein [Corynebacterium hindlerae]|uniref:hypothetical protein n=1 Tax=Corynebacterium hindlerae TaxID=699041 RepID=UPI0031B7111E
MKLTSIVQLYIDPKVVLWYVFFICYLPLLNIVNGASVEVVVFLGSALIVGLIGVDPGRARLYGLSQPRIRRNRLTHAGIVALIITLGLLPGWLISGNINFWGAVAGSVVGIGVQLRRAPEKSFEARQPWTFYTDTVRGTRYDIIFRPMIFWIIVPATIIAMYLITGIGKVDAVSEIIPTSMGYGAAIITGCAVLLKNQTAVSKLYGRAPTNIYRDIAISTGGLVTAIFLAYLVVGLLRGATYEWWHFLPLFAVSLYLHMAILLAAYRKSGIATPLLLFMALFGLPIVFGFYEDEQLPTMVVTLVVALAWLIALVGYLPKRARSGYVGSSGLREVMGQGQKVNI